MMTRMVDTKRKGSTPISMRRGIAPAALLVWMVESTRWPVRAALMARDAVSPSRISPTIIMSGSWRSAVRRPLANVYPISGRTCDWETPSTAATLDDCEVWLEGAASTVVAGGYVAALYWGACPILSGVEAWAIPSVTLYYKSASTVPAVPCGYVLVQTAVEKRVGALTVDLDTAQADQHDPPRRMVALFAGDAPTDPAPPSVPTCLLIAPSAPRRCVRVCRSLSSR